jgi:hypothetical protein
MNNVSVNDDLSSDGGEDIELAGLVDDELILKLDTLGNGAKVYKKYSEIYRGGIYSLSARSRSDNPDWMSQSANSFREILYVLKEKEAKDIREILQEYLGKSLTKKEVERYKEYLNSLYDLFTDLAHHFSAVPDLSLRDYRINQNLKIRAEAISKKDYFDAVRLYKEFLKLLVATALDIHQKIDACIRDNHKKKDLVKFFFNTSPDSKSYFLSQIDDSWLEWLWTNGFFVQLKKAADDVTRYSYSLPELQYIVRMTGTKPTIVANIIASIPISKEAFNPEVVDRFFWIIGLLPIEEIKRILPKVLAENWLMLMSPFGRSGYEYQKMVEKLEEAKDYETLLILAKIILTVRAKEEFTDSERFSLSDKLFYLGDISETGIFDVLTDVKNTKKEESLGLLLNVLSEAVGLGKSPEKTVFASSEPFYLLDVDIFTLELDTRKRSHQREDIQNLVASCKIMIQSTFVSVCENETEARRIYTTYVAALPDSLTCWRLKLYAATRCPALFKTEVEEALFRVFKEGEGYWEINTGAEYHQGLKAGFGVLDSAVQRRYVAKVIEFHGATLEDKEKEKWRKRYGLDILTYIQKYLTPDEVVAVETVFGEIPQDSGVAPHPRGAEITSGVILHKSPFNPGDKTIDELIMHLKTDATPKALSEEYRGDDFLSPRGAEGLGDAIKVDFKARSGEYLSSLNKFFDREGIDPGYVYAILRQVEDMLRAKETFTTGQLLQIINFFDLIRQSGEAVEFIPAEERTYLADWITVHKSMADVLLEILAVTKGSQDFIDNRVKILAIIKYLLSIKSSPDVEDEKRESYESAHMAINSVRGQAYRTFVQYTYNDSNTALSEEVKELFVRVLDTDTSNAVRFTVGQFLASFYFRDIPFIKGLLPKIFPMAEEGKEKLHFATWEGYLDSTLYKELFVELASYYEHAVTTNPDTYPNRKYLKDIDEMLAAHFALAFAHFDFNIDNPLFQLFWKTPNETRHYEFVSFIGRTCITRSEASDEWFTENNVSKEKLIGFWDWILATDIKIEPKAFSGFGFWINPDKVVIDEKIIIKNFPLTLEKSEGDVDWDYGLTRRIKVFAEIDPANTLEVIRRFLLSGDELNTHRRVPLFSLDGEIKDALVTIYKNDALKPKIIELINLLIEKGSSVFWGLKDVIKE